MNDASQLRDLRKQIRETEQEIKDIHSQILAKKNRARQAKQSAIRRSKYPTRLTVVKQQRNRFTGIPAESLDRLEKVRYEVSVKEEKKMSLQRTNQELEEQIALQTQEMEEKEHKIKDLQRQIYKAVEKKKQMISQYELTQQKIEEEKIEIQGLKRLAQDAENAIVSVKQRKDQPQEDCEYEKPQRNRLIELDTRIRKLRNENNDLQNEIAMCELELSKPLPVTEDEEAILFALEDPEADSLQDNVMRKAEQLRTGENKLKILERKINNLHRVNYLIENRYNILRKLANESIPISETVTDETVDQLIKRLEAVTADAEDDVVVANQMLQELITKNSETETMLEKKLAELDLARKTFAHKKQQLRKQIREHRDKTSDREAELVDRIREIRRKLARHR